MASIQKHSSDTMYFIRHNMRELPPDKIPSNLEIDDLKTNDNYDLINRGNTAQEINNYRHKIMNEIFKYKRKNLVQSIEVCITLPSDCPPSQEKAFFKASLGYVSSTLPMGEKCIFYAGVHCDEGHILKDGKTVIQGSKHMHIMYVPAVPDAKHEGFKYKLCADQLTKKADFKAFHPNFQKYLDNAGIKATVHSGVTDGKNITVKALKDLSKKTGLTLTDLQNIDKVMSEKNAQISQLKDQLNNSHTVSDSWGSSSAWGTTKSIDKENIW